MKNNLKNLKNLMKNPKALIWSVKSLETDELISISMNEDLEVCKIEWTLSGEVIPEEEISKHIDFHKVKDDIYNKLWGIALDGG